MADRKRWVWVVFLSGSLGVGCVSAQHAPVGQGSATDGYQGSYVTAPPQIPSITTNASLQPQSSNSFSDVVKSTTGRISSSLHKMGDALTIQPKVEVPEDPLSLTSQTRPFGPDMYLAAARMFEQKGDLVQANLQMEKALELDPRNRGALISLARMKHRTGALEEANRLYQQIIQMFPEDPVPRNDLGLCLARQGRLEESLAVLSQAVKQRPESKLYRNNIATVLLEAGRNDEALHHLTQVLEPAQAYHNLAYLLQQRGDQVNAEQYLARAQQLGIRFAAQANHAVRNVESQANALSSGAVRIADLTQQTAVQQVNRLQQEVRPPQVPGHQGQVQQPPTPQPYRPPVLRAPAPPQAQLPQALPPQSGTGSSSPAGGAFGYRPQG